MEPFGAPNEAAEVAEAVLFRPSKKRKVYRQRALDVPNPLSPQPVYPQVPGPISVRLTTDDAIPSDEVIEDTQVAMSEILRLRKLRKHRVGGVEFRASAVSGGERQDGAVVLHEINRTDEKESEAKQGAGVARRFARQTGMVGDVDKHMMAYVDSELAKRRLNAVSSTITHDESADRLDGPESSYTETTKISKSLEKQPATLGKLLEIDLGDEVRDKNVMRTEQARRRLGGEEVEDESIPQGKRKKPKLGRDGKPWRERKRRTSDDIRRDKLVEEVLRENKIEMYEEPPPPLAAASGDGEADDQIAEAFRREFLDAISQRHRRKVAPNNAPSSRGPGGKKEEEIVRGPKLGGSRSARAAMREAQLKEAKTKTKTGKK